MALLAKGQKMTENPVTPPTLETGAEFRKRQKGKNIALGLAVVGLCVLFYVISIVRMGGLA